MIPACDNMLDDLQIRLAEVKKGGTFGSKSPLMKIRKVRVRTYICVSIGSCPIAWAPSMKRGIPFDLKKAQSYFTGKTMLGRADM